MSRRAATGLAAVLLALAALFFGVRVFLPALTTMSHSFPAYYTASRLVLEGRWSPQIYGEGWFEARVLEMTNGQVSDRFSLHPPVTSLLLVPIAWLDLTSARVVWEIFNLALFAGAMGLLLRASTVQDNVWRMLFVALALVYTPMAENFRVGQTYVLLLFLFALALWSQRESGLTARGRGAWTGLGLGLAAGLKLSGLPLWLLFAARRQWRELVAAVVVLLATGILGLVLGWEGTLAFAERLLGASQTSALTAHVAFQTTPSYFQHLFVPSPDFNPMPLFNAPWLATVLDVIAVVGALGLTLWFGRKARIELAFAAAVTLSVILFPQALEYHYTLLLIPLAVMSAQVYAAPTRWSVIGLAVILVLLVMPFNWNISFWNQGAWSLLAYPRLYGGWLLWGWLVMEVREAAVKDESLDFSLRSK